MPAKKKAAKAPARKPKPAQKTASKAVKRPTPKKAPMKKMAPKKAAPRAAPKTMSAAKPVPAGASALAQKMAAFSQKVLEEEEAPVAVRSFNEARKGIDQSKELHVKTGQVIPAADEEEDFDDGDDDDDDDDDDGPTPMPGPAPAPRPFPPLRSNQPRLDPLAGPMAVPKPRHEEFQVPPPPPKGKKGQPLTKDDMGRIELRMQRGSGDEKIAEASPDYLQRSFNKAAQAGKTAAARGSAHEAAAKDHEFEVAMDRGAGVIDPKLTDFGDVEIAQQTRRGSKKVGRLDTDDEDQDQ